MLAPYKKKVLMGVDCVHIKIYVYTIHSLSQPSGAMAKCMKAIVSHSQNTKIQQQKHESNQPQRKKFMVCSRFIVIENFGWRSVYAFV